MCDESLPSATPFLSEKTFLKVLDSTPLISIDLIVRNSKGQILLGLRTNRPAQGYWFVPGGRIYKNESLANAFKRLTKDELGIELAINSAKYLGLYEHFYEDCAFDLDNETPKTSTHYVVNGFEVELPEPIDSGLGVGENKSLLPLEQHESYRWMSECDLLAASDVHIHSKWYFDKNKGYL